MGLRQAWNSVKKKVLSCVHAFGESFFLTCLFVSLTQARWTGYGVPTKMRCTSQTRNDNAIFATESRGKVRRNTHDRKTFFFFWLFCGDAGEASGSRIAFAWETAETHIAHCDPPSVSPRRAALLSSAKTHCSHNSSFSKSFELEQTCTPLP